MKKMKMCYFMTPIFTAMFVSENGMKHVIQSKIHPMNTIEAHLRHFKQAFWYLHNIGKVVFYKMASGGQCRGKNFLEKPSSQQGQ